ncbi:Formyltransferase/hydrolase complex Fhc subunit B [Tautonia plasticadhaerens]|uniref:Formyltransferase/hydrolase complex Fhc subunit B n=1 Tax=Tautonia plasticadhaerens TaxID=2527974 RepID=A0A518H6K2_9BACT|nr:Formyltransferase/hydrolase complex Fhc subunit B [Tautonia plasticadhaerens]
MRGRVDDATCLACGLLCDDITLTVRGDRIVEAERACPRGRAWFLDDHRHADRPPATIDGRPATLEQAIDRAAALLAASKAPMVGGLSGTTVEAQAVAVELADRVGAVIDPAHSASARPRVEAIQRAGGAFASFGEVKSRADVIILWDLQPWIPGGRLWDRLIEPPGRFVPGGRSGRTVLVVDRGDSASRGRADSAIAIPPERHAEAFRALRAMVLGMPVDPARVGRSCGVPAEELGDWAERLRGARYGVIAFAEGLGAGGLDAIEALMRLVDDLNRTTRCVALPLAGPGNPAGAEAVLTGRLGAPLAVDLSDGAPRYRPLDAEGQARLDRGEVDVVLDLEGVGSPRSLSGSVPAIRISPGATADPVPDGVSIACAMPGIDGGGTVVRSDEVSLPLRPALDPSRPIDRAVLSAILDRLET